MNNEKVVKILEVTIQICNIAVVVAKTLIPLFPVKKQEVVSNQDSELIRQFLEQKEFVK